MGDSVTYGKRHNFSEKIQQLCDKNRFNYEILNAGTEGVTIEVGYTRLLQTVISYSPDVLVVMYGWNDHWLKHQSIWQSNTDFKSDAAKKLHEFIFKYIYSIRLLKIMLYKLTMNKLPFLVSIRKYEEYLNNFYKSAIKNNIKLVLMTSPYGYYADQTPLHLTHLGNIIDPLEVICVHNEYNACVRSFAAKYNVELIDMEKIINEYNKKILTEDYIHFTNEGNRLAAEIIFSFFIKRGIIKSKKY